MTDDLPSPWRDRLRALRDVDRASAPPFERLLVDRVESPRRRVRPAWFVAAAATAAASLVLLRPVALDPAQLSWTHWRSPTAVLLVDGIGPPVLAAWQSPTAGLATFASTP